MPCSIQFTQEEAQRVFASFVPGFRANAHGRYRGPAIYRGGDNKQALCIDTKQGIWFDFVTDEGGDVIAFVQKCKRCSFREACLIIGAIIGRNILLRALSGSPIQ